MTQPKDGSPGLALVKLDFSTGMNRGADEAVRTSVSPKAEIEGENEAKSHALKTLTISLFRSRLCPQVYDSNRPK